MTYNNTELIRKFEMPEGKTLGKPSCAEILLRYRIINQEKNEQTFNDVIEIAENAGWKRDFEWKGGEFSASFEKERKMGEIYLRIILVNEDYIDENSNKELSISLNHR